MKQIKILPNGGFVKVDLDKLVRIKDQLNKQYITRVGIIGSKTNRLVVEENETHAQYKKRVNDNLKSGHPLEGAELTNAEIGYVHEFGIGKMPRRSFLEMPLNLKIPDYYKTLGDKFLKAINEGNIRKMYVDLGIKAEGIIQDAFSSSGYGNWQANAPETIEKKGSSRPLIDTAQLRKSISSDVITK